MGTKLVPILMGLLTVMTGVFFTWSGTFMWRTDDRLYEIRREQTQQTTILTQQRDVLVDHEKRIRALEGTD